MWIIVDRGVYDVTSFWRNHPGGSAMLAAKVCLCRISIPNRFEVLF